MMGDRETCERQVETEAVQTDWLVDSKRKITHHDRDRTPDIARGASKGKREVVSSQLEMRLREREVCVFCDGDMSSQPGHAISTAFGVMPLYFSSAML
jgi:hypothetical protein